MIKKNHYFGVMSVNIFELEYEIKASAKMVFPFLSSASGLATWFADDVNIKPNGMFDFIWDDESHLGSLTVKKANKTVVIDLEEGENKIIFDLDINEFTQSLFIKVTDGSDMADSIEECEEIWDTLFEELREQFGG